MKRRTFLKSSAVGIPLMVNGLNISAIPKSSMFSSINGNDKVLVIIQLYGGNDGLNTLIPLDQYDKLANLRQNVIIPESSILPIEGNNGFHPAIEGMRNLYTEGNLNIIQDVGYPNQDRSHFRSVDIWNTGASAFDEFVKTGWAGRYFDSLYPNYPDGYPNADCPDPFAISMGFTVHENCQGVSSNFSTALVDPDNLSNIIESEEGFVDLNTCYGSELQFVRQSIAQTNAYASSISSASSSGNNIGNYSDESLSQQLKTVARLISGGLQTSIYTVSLSTFDTHANQVVGGDTTLGEHARLLKIVSDAIAEFHADLKLLEVDQRVVGMTYSEFGRQIKSNNSLGTDHGTAAPLFVFGTCINAGIIGNNYEIPEEVPNQAGVPMQYDFRSVYGSILMDWLGAEESLVQDLLYEDFQHIPIIENCLLDNTKDLESKTYIESHNYPNPFQKWTTIHFNSNGGWFKISIFDTLGQEIKVVTNQNFASGEHQIPVDMSSFPQGMYHYRIVSKYAQQTRNMQKIN